MFWELALFYVKSINPVKVPQLMRMVSRCLQVAPMLATRFVQIGLFEPFRFSLRNLVSLQSMS